MPFENGGGQINMSFKQSRYSATRTNVDTHVRIPTVY